MTCFKVISCIILMHSEPLLRNPLKSAIGSGNKKPLSHSTNPLSQAML